MRMLTNNPGCMNLENAMLDININIHLGAEVQDEQQCKRKAPSS